MFGVVNADENHAPNIVTDDPFVDANEHRNIDETVRPPAQEENLTVADIKIAKEVRKADTNSMPILEAAMEAEVETTSINRHPSEGDTGSVHSLPVTHVTETQSTQSRPSTALARSSSGATPITSSAGARTQQSAIRDTAVTAGERMNRHRSGVEVYTELLVDFKSYGG